jgi:CDP-paratose 2-epimerase
MKTVIVTGSCGLIGNEACYFFKNLGFRIVGIDNDMRKYFFGDKSSTSEKKDKTQKDLGDAYFHYDSDIRDLNLMEKIFSDYSSDISLVIHTAAQPSHDWASREPITDFSVNATGTLNLLECTRKYCPDAVFIFTSTNKVYGDLPNKLDLIETDTRWELPQGHRYFNGINETLSIDQCTHSLFGASKVSADVMVQEYGRYFGMKTGVFRGGCLTGPLHSGAELHGFLSYLITCATEGIPYTIYGYKGKQVRDNIHSYDLVSAFNEFYKNPRPGEVYNIGGSRHSNISVLEAIYKIQERTGKTVDYSISSNNRTGDHIWYISDVSKFMEHYPQWGYKYNMDLIIDEMTNFSR